ncbi:coiled-coil domain-containing glutamate-rich protein 1-like [Scleropages formosus]|nr:uncharacterized protein LOC108929791 [Scleropages formosus]KPP76231.1 coiled-coil domain-containing glutamate-rich protein 1-like [Scleropages formosus]
MQDDMCGKGLMCQWRGYGGGPPYPEPQEHSARWERKRGCHRGARRQHRCRGQSGNRPQGHRLPYARQHRLGPWLPGNVSLRPINNQGSRAPGMRAPRNTNQFLMHEKYQMMHMRSDSVGTDSGSDCDMDFTDMDSYLGTLENARGALMDALVDGPKSLMSPVLREESMQYFPSEDDVMQSEDFMQKDFIEFCSALGSVAPHEVPSLSLC